MLSQPAWERFHREAERLGLNLVSALSVTRETALFAPETPPPGATHGVVVMQAGGAFWEALRALRARDAALDGHPDPLDEFTRRMAARLAGLLGPAHLETRYPHSSKLDFVSLGEAAGLGRRSRLAMLIHPTYGPWTAFRMLFFVAAGDGLIAPPARLPEAACATCTAPCIAACPAGAIHGATGAERLDYALSLRYRRGHPGVCADACDARLACPVGLEHRYAADSIRHSHRRAWAAGLALLGSGASAAPSGQQSLF